jgi:flagellar biosynthesis protein FliQ
MMRENAKKREAAQKLARRKAIKNGLIIAAALLGSVLVVGVFVMMIMWAKKGG